MDPQPVITTSAVRINGHASSFYGVLYPAFFSFSFLTSFWTYAVVVIETIHFTQLILSTEKRHKHWEKAATEKGMEWIDMNNSIYFGPSLSTG